MKTIAELKAMLAAGVRLYHYYTYSEQWIFDVYDPSGPEQAIGVFQQDDPLTGTTPVSF